MLLIPVFLAAFAFTFFMFRKRGEKTPDCIHKGLVAGILVTLAVFSATVVASYF